MREGEGYAWLSVLLVDDQPFIRLTVRQLLTQLDIRHIEEAGDGEEALKVLGFRKVDLILLDIEMEPMNGIDCLRAIRSSRSDHIKDVPVIMLTTHADEQHVLDLKELGIQGYVAKPPSMAAVQKSVERVFEGLTRGKTGLAM